ncbi:interphotoreceptor matrix proteoglycan 2 isoform X1 [Channa argus]|uniref:interphotoreceptor matrix proteoglycan 2 isoform X1 n=2 Tax=Channa argus TaxID=215402 RepID=UPI0035227C33
MGYLSLSYIQEPPGFPHIVRVSDVKVAHRGHGVLSRWKRNILFPSGVKLCAQETAQQVVANHLSYFHLRVCQETIWEAFKIFWDRLPGQGEYQSWMSQCQEGTITAKAIGSYFSQSEEHQALVKKRMSLPGVKSEPTRSWQHMCSTETPDISEAAEAPELAKDQEGEEAATLVPDVEESTLDNDIAVMPPTSAVLEQVVELSILLTGEMYSDDLKDSSSLHYQTLSRQLAGKIEDALEGLPGFKSVSVLDFRPPKDAQGLNGVVVDYAVTVDVDVGTGVSNDQLDYLTLQSNLVENSYHEVKEHPTVVYTIGEVKSFATEAPESVSEIPEPVNAADGATVTVVDQSQEYREDDFLPGPSETNTMTSTEKDIIILEESTIVSPPPPPTLITIVPEAGSIEEEGLLLKETVQTPAVENPLPEDLPAEPPSVELPVDFTLPEPAVEPEASGSGTENPEDLLQATRATEKEAASLEESASEDRMITEGVHIDSDAISETKDVTAQGGQPIATDIVTLKEKHPSEVVVNEPEIPEEMKVSTITTETPEEDGLPVLVPTPELPSAAEICCLPVSEGSVDGTGEDSILSDVPPVDVEVNLKEPGEDPATNVLANSEPSGISEESGFKEGGVEEATEAAGSEGKEEPEATKISTNDLTQDEILPVDKEGPKPPVKDSLSPVQPTTWSSERLIPFTRISDVIPESEGHPDNTIPSVVEMQTTNEGLDDSSTGDPGYDVVQYGFGPINHTEEGSTGFPFGVAHNTDQASIAMPVNPGRALMVFFSLRVTNMIFSEDLFNKSSPEYKALEQRFLELLVPYLQSNLSHFENLEILNFRNGSIVVNSRMKFGKPVPRGVTTTVYLILEDFCNTAYQTMNLAIDKYSLDVESGDQADPCKFQACNEYAECKVNKWSGEAECVCNAGYFSVDGLPCQSICELQTDFCLNDGKCDIIPGQGAICRCRVGENWWYRGEHCEEYVSEPLVVGIAITSVAGFLLVASGVIFFLARTLRDQYDKDESEDPIRRAESLPSLERATKYNPMYESEATTGYSHYYRRYPEVPVYSSASAEASTDFSSEEIRHIYENSELTKEEIQDRIRIIELYAKDRQFADFVRQHQTVLDTQRENSSIQT